jgi:hypothetical protein
MRLHTDTHVCRQVAVPPDARAFSTLAHIDYEDAFVVDTAEARERTAEEWARAILDDAPVGLRATLWPAWSVLGLRLGSPRSRRSVLGWEIRRSTPDVALLGARSRIGMPAELLVRRQAPGLLFATFVQKQTPVARAVWAAIDRLHRPIVRLVLGQAIRRARDEEAGG